MTECRTAWVTREQIAQAARDLCEYELRPDEYPPQRHIHAVEQVLDSVGIDRERDDDD